MSTYDHVIARLIQANSDFGNHAGPFSNLSYFVPADEFTSRGWVRRTGLTADVLRPAIVEWSAYKLGLLQDEPATRHVIDLLKASVNDWIEKTGYRASPIDFSNAPNIRDRRVLRAHMIGRLEAMGFDRIHSRADFGEISVQASLDKFLGYRVVFNLTVKTRYANKIYGSLSFRHLGSRAAVQFSDSRMFGKQFLFELGLGDIPGVEWFVEADGPPYPTLDEFVAVYATFLSYLKTED